MKIICVIILSVMISACSTKVENKPIIEQQNLLQKCTDDTPIPTFYELDSDGKKVYNGKEALRVLREFQNVYNDCAVMHNKLVDTIIEIEEKRSIDK